MSACERRSPWLCWPPLSRRAMPERFRRLLARCRSSCPRGWSWRPPTGSIPERFGLRILIRARTPARSRGGRGPGLLRADPVPRTGRFRIHGKLLRGPPVGGARPGCLRDRQARPARRSCVDGGTGPAGGPPGGHVVRSLFLRWGSTRPVTATAQPAGPSNRAWPFRTKQRVIE